MNTKIKLQDEPVFLGRNSLFFQTLNQKGIYTVEDYINADIEQIMTSTQTRNKVRAYKRILKYKYLGEPLVVDVLLDKQYHLYGSDKEMISDVKHLGFDGLYCDGIRERYSTNYSHIKMISIVLGMVSKYSKRNAGLVNFYEDYYYTKIKNQETNEIASDKDSLDSLKNELVSLINKRNELETQISSLLEQINTLEGGKSVNARK